VGASDERIGAVFDVLGDIALSFDDRGRLTHVSAVAAEFLAGRVGPGDTWRDLLNAVSADLTEQEGVAIPRTVAEQGFWRGQMAVSDAAGGEETYAATVARGGDDHAQDGQAFFVVLRSLGETRRREAAERELEVRDEFTARLGHELRTPLNAVLGFAQLLELEEDLDRQQRDGVERILTAGRHMQALLDDVLDLARVRTGGVDLDVGPVRVLEVVRGVVDLIQPLADKRGIRRYVEPAEDLIALLDRRRLWQVLLNLIGNAVKYGREGGTVRVGINSTDDGRLRIEVADDGPGIEPAQLDRLFRPFERLGAERTGVEGTGLGLALSKALTAAMGGTLSASSQLGVGSTFALDLEAVGSDEMAALSEEPAAPVTTVVHVGADPNAQALVARALRNRLSVEVVSISRAAPALDAIHRGNPSVVVIDTDLPDAVGTELLHRLSADPLSALVPKVVLTADADPRTHLRLRAAGAVAVLRLPLDVRRFVDTISDLLTQRPPTAAEAPPD
jgi:signal transduction histidine kinase/ActR/RegA family two-component response regulator